MGNTLSILTNKTFVGYATLLIACGAFIFSRQNGKQAKQQKTASQKQRVQDSRDQPKKENKAKRQRMESFASESSRQPQPNPQSKSYATATSSTAKHDSSDEGIGNREFAKQMAQNKKNKFAPKVNNEQKQKSVKQSKAKDLGRDTPADNGKASAPSAPSSTTGIDGDDDQSSAASPVVSAADPDPTGISDMLEQPSSGPSVLRLTDTAEKQQKLRQAKSPQPTETKKQRQNRQKAERAKAQREEDEKARKVLLEAQRRAAREAEGRAAKDGSTFTAAPKSSAWTQVNGKSGKSAQPAEPAPVQPLDTFENTPKASAAAPAAPAQKKENAKQNGGKTSWADIPYSEEEQLKMLEQEAEEWVPVSKSRKKKAKNTNAVSETDESAAENYTATTGTKPASKANDVNGRPKAKALPSQSSFAALSDDGANLADQQEQEWDV